MERKDVTPDTAEKFGRTPLSLAEEREHIRVVEMLLERRRAGQGMVMKDLAGQAAISQNSKKKRRGVSERKLGDQSSVPQSVGKVSDSQEKVYWAKPSESSRCPSKRIRRS